MLAEAFWDVLHRRQERGRNTARDAGLDKPLLDAFGKGRVDGRAGSHGRHGPNVSCTLLHSTQGRYFPDNVSYAGYS